MPAGSSPEVKFEIGHVLFIDIVGYSKGLINEQSELLQKLKEIVRGTEQFRIAEAEGKLLRLPTGDGGALVFRNSPEAPVLCAMEIAKELKSHPEPRVRMGIHSGPVNEITDLNEQANIAGAGINIAQRVMDCGDAGHILLSRHVAEDLESYGHWKPLLHDLGECEVKHGVRVAITNLYTEELGNPRVPERFRKAKSTGKKIVAITVVPALIVAALLTFLLARHSSKAPTIPVDKSLAVLPLVNQSGDASQEYFSDGLTDELINGLGHIRQLRVIGRNSCFQYKGKTQDSRAIGQALGVTNLLEGSVRRAADRIRIAVQLVKAADGSQLWSETYDRQPSDVFDVQQEIARAVADQLRIALLAIDLPGGSEPSNKSLDAYNAFLRGTYYRVRNSPEDLKLALQFFDEAIRFDPGYAEAYAQKARVLTLITYAAGAKGTESYDEARAAVQTALRLNPKLSAGHAIFAYIYRIADWNLEAANAELDAANSRDAIVLNFRAIVTADLGRLEEAIKIEQQAIAIDPAFQNYKINLGAYLTCVQRYDEAETSLREAIALDPKATALPRNLLTVCEALRGQPEAAMREAQQAPPGVLRDLAIAVAQVAGKDRGEAKRALTALDDKYSGDWPFRVAAVQAFAGNTDRAFELLERAYAVHDPRLVTLLDEPLFHSVYSDPRFAQTCKKVGLPVPK